MIFIWFLWFYFNICLGQFNFTECGHSKLCLYVPKDCQQNCKAFSYRSGEEDWLVMEIFYEIPDPAVNYIAIGFSKDNLMGDEPVTHCAFKEGKVEAHLSYNSRKLNRPLLESENDNLKLIEGHYFDSKFYCKFQQRIKRGKDLNLPSFNENYTLLFAHGKTDNLKKLAIHSLDINSDDFPTSSEKKFTFVENGINLPLPTTVLFLSQKTKKTFVALHGFLMIVSWFLLIASAISAARYLRDHWPSKIPFGLRIWFHIHRILNATGVCLVIISCFFIFVVKDFRWTGPAVGHTLERNLSYGSIHSLVGVLSVILAVMQPFGSLLRCAPDNRYRPIFNWSHRIAGIITFLLAVVATVIAVIFFKTFINHRFVACLLLALYIATIVIFITASELILPRKHQCSLSTELKSKNNGQNRGEIINVIMANKDNQKMRMLAVSLYFSFCIFALGIVVGFGFIIFA